jgi:hypothetical protein
MLGSATSGKPHARGRFLLIEPYYTKVTLILVPTRNLVCAVLLNFQTYLNQIWFAMIEPTPNPVLRCQERRSKNKPPRAANPAQTAPHARQP